MNKLNITFDWPFCCKYISIYIICKVYCQTTLDIVKNLEILHSRMRSSLLYVVTGTGEML